MDKQHLEKVNFKVENMPMDVVLEDIRWYLGKGLQETEDIKVVLALMDLQLAHNKFFMADNLEQEKAHLVEVDKLIDLLLVVVKKFDKVNKLRQVRALWENHRTGLAKDRKFLGENQ